MKIVAVSDTHNQAKQLKLPDGDWLIHAGDFSLRGRDWETKEFADWMHQQKDKFKRRIFIAGNHDFGFQNQKYEMLKYFDPDVIYLDHEFTILDGIKIFGSPYTPKFYDWAFMKPDEVLAGLWQSIPDDVELLITHGPPHSILDMNSHGENCGSKSLYQTIKDLPNLKTHIFGHIHENSGNLQVDNVKFYNVSVLNANYVLTNPPTVIEV